MSLTSLPQNKETWLPQPASPGLVFRLGVLIPQGLDTLLSHVSEHRECGLHNEVDETYSEEGNTVAISSLEGWVVHMAGMAVTRLQSSQWGQPLGDVLVTPANSPPSHSPRPQPSTSGPHTLAYQAGFYRKNGFEAWRLGVVLAQAQTASFPFPPCRKGHSPIWDCATRVEVRSHSGEKGRPSSASLSPCGRRQGGKAGEDILVYKIWGAVGGGRR